jgi:tRNA 5-methylaminomethyl-2-thiouridine biosynthesis bifunctional protein
VFLAGNQLPARWAHRDRFTVLDTCFGGGHKFLATWAAWQQDADRCKRLFYLAIEPRPPRRDQLAGWHAGTPLAALATMLAAQWPPLTPDLHVIDLAGGRLRLLLALGDITNVLPEWVASVDAFYLDGPAAEPSQAAWDARRLRRLPRLAAPGATLAARSRVAALQHQMPAAALQTGMPAVALQTGQHAAALPDGLAAAALPQALTAAGFTLQTLRGTTDRAAFTAAVFAPRFMPPAPPGRQALAGVKTVAVVGAGLAGAAVARALAAQGLAVQVFDRRDGPARETSGNPGGLFHGIVHGHDGPHARWLRSAALRTEQVLRPLVDGGLVDGAVAGLLRGEQAQGLPAMQALLDRLGLPADYVQAWPAALRGGGAAWFYPGGGWVAPAALCAHWLAAPGISTRFDTAVQALLPHGKGWQLQGAEGRWLATVDAVVLCSAADIGRLLASPAAAAGTVLGDDTVLGDGTPLPRSAIHHHLHRVRGQITVLAAATPGLPALPLPLADTGYALTLADGRLLCGASAQPEGRDSAADHDEGLRPADHAHNLATLARLTGWVAGGSTTPLAGRVAWRQQSDDRLPLLGPVPALWAEGLIGNGNGNGHGHGHGHGHGPTPPAVTAPRPVQARLVPRQAGLYVFTALGSRGISHAALGGEVLAAWINGDPVPAPASLLDALDPARFIARTARRPG